MPVHVFTPHAAVPPQQCVSQVADVQPRSAPHATEPSHSRSQLVVALQVIPPVPHAFEPSQSTVHAPPLHPTPPVWQVFGPSHSTSHVAA